MKSRACSSEKETDLYKSSETIYALSTAPGRAAIATIRVSGPHSLLIYNSLCPTTSLPKPRQAVMRKLYDPLDRKIILDNTALVLYFPAPKSVTGEDILEFHIHGGPATQKAVLSSISKCASTMNPIRYAEPGEFTRRAFYNDKIDLAQVEALSDMLSAETEQQRRAAVRADSNKLGKLYDSWREKLLHARGEIEALIDFSEDQNFDVSTTELLANVTRRVNEIVCETFRHEAASHCGELLRKGIKISLLGPPNTGKSSLLNRIVKREASIVSQEAGTTRDIVEMSLEIHGYLCTIADTAGLRSGSTQNPWNSMIGKIEEEGIRRAKLKASESDIIILMASLEFNEASNHYFIEVDMNSLDLVKNNKYSLIVVNKCDLAICSDHLKVLLDNFKSRVAKEYFPSTPPEIIPVSCHTFDTKTQNLENDQGNLPYLISRIASLFKNMTDIPIDMRDLIGVTERQRLLLSSCRTHLQNFKSETDIVLAAENLRLAATYLARITGRGEAADTEEILGIIFDK
ncbi:tRNA modification GTPase, mitochondrial [Blumeria hordei DH14]|uniref:tRNA modification GTPase, mitochondrial n=1 Tax=Blumeria graminis f. sp. hordei (strain DH14) TaxID=546991 RepID=N1JJL9_BLUG1|nr:tRNA modification GTPase, mitochondrial [Blumeria hordei DH14]